MSLKIHFYIENIVGIHSGLCNSSKAVCCVVSTISALKKKKKKLSFIEKKNPSSSCWGAGVGESKDSQNISR